MYAAGRGLSIFVCGDADFGQSGSTNGPFSRQGLRFREAAPISGLSIPSWPRQAWHCRSWSPLGATTPPV